MVMVLKVPVKSPSRKALMPGPSQPVGLGGARMFETEYKWKESQYKQANELMDRVRKLNYVPKAGCGPAPPPPIVLRTAAAGPPGVSDTVPLCRAPTARSRNKASASVVRACC